MTFNVNTTQNSMTRLASYDKKKTGWENVQEVTEATRAAREPLTADFAGAINGYIQMSRNFLFFKLAYIDDTAVGYAVAHDKSDDVIELDLILVSPEYRKKDVGVALMTELVRKAQNKDYKSIAFTYHFRARNFYTRFFQNKGCEFQIEDSPPMFGIPIGGRMWVTIKQKTG